MSKTELGAWLRAAVLGASDGIVSTASLVLGVAAADASTMAIATAGMAGLVGGALSMAAGEYVSVSAQLEVQRAELDRERELLAADPDRELDELAELLIKRGLPIELAVEAAEALTEHDALAAHAREHLNIHIDELARPGQAAVASAVAFAIGAAMPLISILVVPSQIRLWAVMLASVLTLAGLGAWSANLAGVRPGPTMSRVVVGGALAMAATTLAGYLFAVLF